MLLPHCFQLASMVSGVWGIDSRAIFEAFNDEVSPSKTSYVGAEIKPEFEFEYLFELSTNNQQKVVSALGP